MFMFVIINPIIPTGTSHLLIVRQARWDSLCFTTPWAQ